MTTPNALKTAAKIIEEAGNLELSRELLVIHDEYLEQQKRIGDLEADNEKLRVKATPIPLSRPRKPGR